MKYMSKASETALSLSFLKTSSTPSSSSWVLPYVRLHSSFISLILNDWFSTNSGSHHQRPAFSEKPHHSFGDSLSLLPLISLECSLVSFLPLHLVISIFWISGERQLSREADPESHLPSWPPAVCPPPSLVLTYPVYAASSLCTPLGPALYPQCQTQSLLQKRYSIKNCWLILRMLRKHRYLPF